MATTRTPKSREGKLLSIELVLCRRSDLVWDAFNDESPTDEALRALAEQILAEIEA